MLREFSFCGIFTDLNLYLLLKVDDLLEVTTVMEASKPRDACAGHCESYSQDATGETIILQ